MKRLQRFFGWFFLVIGTFGLFQQPIAGIVYLSWAFLLLPFTNRFAANRGWQLSLWKRWAIALLVSWSLA
jgi:hypothetical protein